jgi:hypothetical protein
MVERERQNRLDVRCGHVLGSFERGERHARTHDGEICPERPHAVRANTLADDAEEILAERDGLHTLPGPMQPPRKRLLLVAPRPSKCAGVRVEFDAPLDGVTPSGCVHGRRHIHDQCEAIEELRPEAPLFGIHAADENESRLLPHTETFALDDMDAAGDGVEQRIRQMVREEIDLVDVQNATVRV